MEPGTSRASRGTPLSASALPDGGASASRSRADLCRFLAACYYQPTPEFSEEKLFDSLVDAAEQVGPELASHARRLRDHFTAEGIDDLLLDYASLFLGPNDIIAKPYGSVWLSGEQALMQDSTMALLDLYGEGGFELDPGFHEVPDHVAVELEFLYLLLCAEMAAHDCADAEHRTDLRSRFLRQQLAPWIGSFTGAIMAGAKSNFYRELAILTARFVLLELQRVSGTS